jgi:molybdate transport system substrate-binding protein
MRVWSFRFCAAVTILSSSLAAIAAEIKIISSVGMRAVLEELQPQFERTTQHKLIITFGTAAPLKRQVDEGAAFDVTILTPPMLEDLAKSGKVETGSVVSVAKTGIGLAARKDAAPLDIASAEGLKRALLAAKSVAHSKEGQSGVAAVKIMERLGITEEMKPRIVIETRPGGSVAAVVEGKAELGFALVSEIVPVPEVKLVGPVPGDLQSYTVFAAGVSSSTKDAPAARSFVEFLRGAGARSTLSAKGMEGM